MRVALLSLMLMVGGVAVPVAAQAMMQSYHLNIPRQPLDGALKDLARQTDIQIGRFSDSPWGSALVGPLSGDMSLDAALRSLLASSRLTYKVVNDHTIAITAADSVSAPASPSAAAPQLPPSAQEDTDKKEGKKSSSDEFRMAQTDQGISSSASALGNRTQSYANSSNRPATLEEIVVTAQKRAERLQDVPISIVALTADELQKRNITSVDDLQFSVPGLAIQSDGALRTIYIRGISNGFGGGSLIGVYLDEADVTAATGAAYIQLDLNTYDLDRVEVLRGPQGTLFGDGSAGGTIRFITKNPNLTRFEFNSDVAALFTQDGAPGERVQAAVNVPLIDNVLGLRAAVKFDNEGGWVNQPAANRKDINGLNRADVRIKGLWQPTTPLTVSAMAEIHRLDGMQNVGEDDNGNYTQVFNLQTTPSVVDDFDIYNLTLSYDFDAVRILSTTSYVDHSIEARDYGRTFQFTPPGTPRFEEYFSNQINSDDVNEELRATSSGSGPWQWTVGGFYRRSREEYNLPGYYFAIPGPPGTPLPAPYLYGASTTRSKVSAVFGDTSYKITDRLMFGTGVRYFEDRQSYTFDATQSGKFHSLDPRFYAQYKLAEAANVYTSAAKGFRSGGFNSLDQPSYGPESVWTYELGTKMSLLGGRLSADAAVFRSNYTNYQIVGILPPPQQPFNITSNAGSARIDGVEWDLSWRPVDPWSLSFNGDYLHARFTEIGVTDSSYELGDNLDFVPKYTFTLSAERDFIWNGKSGFVRLDYNQVGHATFRNRSFGSWYFSESDITHMLNFNTSLDWNDNLRLGVFAQNLLNNRGYISPAVIEANASRSRPRTIGVEFSVKLD